MKDDVARKAAHLSEIVRGHHDLDAGLRRALHDLLDATRRGRIEIGGRLVEQKNLGIASQRARQRQPLLFAARKPPRRSLRQIGQPDPLQQRGDPLRTFAARDAGQRQRIGDIGGGGPSQHHRTLKQDRATRHRAIGAASPTDVSGRWRIQSHAEPQQAGLAGAVRSDDQCRRTRRNGQVQPVKDRG